MAEELNTSMHEEFIGKEIPNLDLRVMATYGAMRRGLSKKEALARKLWLHFFNRTLREKGFISEEEFRRMQRKIEASSPGTFQKLSY